MNKNSRAHHNVILAKQVLMNYKREIQWTIIPTILYQFNFWIIQIFIQSHQVQAQVPHKKEHAYKRIRTFSIPQTCIYCPSALPDSNMTHHLSSLKHCYSNFIFCMASSSSSELLSMKKPGCLGWGNTASSWPTVKITDDMVGLLAGSFWTQNKSTWIHLRTWDSTHESLRHASISSKALSSFQSIHA